MNDNKKPWDNEPATLTDADELSQWESEGTEGLVSASHARNLERRMRAAEALLKRVRLTFPGSCDSADIIDIRAHLDAAKKEDGK